MSILSNIQSQLKVNKGQFNKSGNYSYRSLEDIQESLKPLLNKHHYSVVITDEPLLVGDRYFIKSRASLYDEKMQLVIHSDGLAREAEAQKGMSPSQCTGTASSYARKLALSGLFAIDDEKDDDTRDNSQHVAEVKPQVVSEAQLKKINTLISLKKVDREGLKVHYKVESLKDLPLNAVQGLMDYLEAL